MKRSILILTLLFLALALASGCKYKSPTNPAPPELTAPVVEVVVSPATNCAPTTTNGEIQITDKSRPSSAIDRVTGSLFNPTGANVCNWNISRVGNFSASDTCRNLAAAGSYSFEGFIHMNNGQEATQVNGGCTLANPANFEASGSFYLFQNTEAFNVLLADRGITDDRALEK